MKQREYTTVDPKQVQEKYPKSYKLIQTWFFSPDKQPEGEPLFVPDAASSEQFAVGVLQFNPRVLYDFFDDQEVFISLFKNEDGMFTYYTKKISFTSPNRNDAESKAFMIAFEELEEKLA